jgi:hypothetical protein
MQPKKYPRQPPQNPKSTHYLPNWPQLGALVRRHPHDCAARARSTRHQHLPRSPAACRYPPSLPIADCTDAPLLLVSPILNIFWKVFKHVMLGTSFICNAMDT